MGFRTSRGRPKNSAINLDLGTPELRQKRIDNLTKEPLDRCFELGLLSEEEHRSSLYWRWLYTIKHGAPSPAQRLLHEDFSSQHRDEEWRAEKIQEFNYITAYLSRLPGFSLFQNMVIYQRWPRFIVIYEQQKKLPNLIAYEYTEYKKLSEELIKILKKRKEKKLLRAR